MDSVVVGIPDVRQDLATVKMDHITIVDPVTPSGWLVCHRHIRHRDIPASGEKDGTRKRLRTGYRPFEMPSLPIVSRLLLNETSPVAVDGPAARNRNVLRLIRIDDGNVTETRHTLGEVMPDICPFRIIRQVGRRQQGRVRFDMQFHTAFQFNGRSQENASGKDYPAAS